ncbi:hypothetical protein AM587_10002073 [Phytophthora nicotianae]|uniref:Uncharacterized protein n=1 Tax=Phytophthora nicotianae TaxID=4792 RepID=A0A0W8DSH1_PHYNI|nr:hypothetical protein AM587_10004586 [Phytophthora nicotianae]KUF99281.1 hypothetical protein AM587_10002073 [Phytophthora nicotianae]
MLKEETQPQDVAYSDDEVGSEHAYGGGDDEFVDEDKEQVAVKQDSPDTEDADQYDVEFDNDDRTEPGTGSQTLATDNTPLDQMPAKADTAGDDPQENGDAYDGEFDEEDHPSVATDSPPFETAETLVEDIPTDADPILIDDEDYGGEFDNDDPVVPDATPPAAVHYDTTMDRTPTAEDLKTMESQDNKENGEVLLDPEKPNGHDQTEIEDSEAEYSNDLENDAPPHVELPKNAVSTPSEGNTTQLNDRDSHITVESGDGANLDKADRVKSRRSSATSGSSTPTNESTRNLNNKFESNSTPNNDDNYTDEMEDEFHTGSNIPEIDAEDKFDDEIHACAYDIDELKDDGRRETEMLLQEASALLELQQYESNNNKLPLQPQEIISSDMMIQQGNNGGEIPGELDTYIGENNENMAENHASPYDADEFVDADADAETTKQETLQQERSEDGEIEQYELDVDEFEDQEATIPRHDDLQEPVEAGNSEKATSTHDTLPQSADTIDSQPNSETAEKSVNKTKDEAVIVSPIEAAPGPANFLSVDSPVKPITIKQDEKEPSNAKESPKLSQKKVASRPARPQQPVQSEEPPAKQPSPPIKPLRPSTKKATTASTTSTIDTKPTSTPRSSRRKPKTATSSPVCVSSEIESHSHESTTPHPPKLKVSSPRYPSKACSDPSHTLSNDDLQLPRKDPLPKQKASSKPSTSGGHIVKRRLLQPVRTPANLHFDLPRMDKAKRDWLFANMFRHGDDLSKYEAFVPPTLLVKPPTTKETKKRPLSGSPYSSRFELPGRKLVPQPNPQLQDRERNWVATTPHDSKLPTYDSILDKYCTRVTCPEVQRQIYQTRQRDLSPQLAFVLEKRVEKHYRKGFYDSFGGVCSYRTEIVPTPPSDGTRQRYMSSHSSSRSGLLEGHAMQ